MFKRSKCGGNICCQAITEDGTRCHRSASKFVSVDITEKQLLPKIPSFIRKKLGVKKVEQLKLIGFANSCCFYCWQHAVIYTLEVSTYTSNFAYYISHPEDLLSIFFKDVKVRKIGGLITYSVTKLGGIRTPDEIIKYIYKTKSGMKGKLSSYYWGIFIMVYFYDNVKSYIISLFKKSNLLKVEKEKITQDMSATAADTLIKISEGRKIA